MTIWSDEERAEERADAQVRRYTTWGVSVRYFRPRRDMGNPPVVLVHGGTHGGWSLEAYAWYLARNGFEVHALDWYNHGESAQLPDGVFVDRSIEDVAAMEIEHVVDGLSEDPILVGHSMGGLAAQAFASRRPVARLALLASGLPVQVQAVETLLPVDSFTEPFDPPPFELARQMFFTTMTDEQAHTLYDLLVPESPRAVWEVTRNTLWGDFDVATETLVLAAEKDAIFAPADEQRLAELLSAEYGEIAGVGHTDLLIKDGAWRAGAEALKEWLAA